MKGHGSLLLLLAAALCAAAASSCSDPVLDDAVDAQGNETSGIAKGPFHRAGQRCIVCHQEGGPASGAPFVVAGTIFAQPARLVGVDRAEVRMTDADGTKFTAKTNCVGNFFVTAGEWQPKFPLLVEVAKGNLKRPMSSPIGREASCAGCHTSSLPVPSPEAQLGHVYLFGSDEPGTPDGARDCAVDAVAPGSP
jgi:mono/diheme cytochrome c family protein